MDARDPDPHGQRSVEFSIGRCAKRLLDIALSLGGLVLLAVPFCAIAFVIRCDSEGPIFFRQERVGKGGRLFRVWKFRTMKPGVAEQGLGRHVSPDETCVTRVGRLLREWGLDELPQLANVLKGDMSLVGPRPVLPRHVARFDSHQRLRLAMKPGITGWALINGRNRLSWKQRVELDIWYIERWSFWLDIRILIATVWIVLVRREGVYGEGDIGL